MRSVRPTTFETEGLQADVMRFLAIIAFCLIAVLALVQQLPREESAVPPAITEVKPATVTPVAPATQPVKPETETEKETPVIQKTETKEEVMPITKTEVVADVIVEEVREQPTPDPRKPLQLRFSSERTFLSLVATGTIHVYIHVKETRSYKQVTRTFAMASASPSGELYEILPASMPRQIQRLAGGEATYLVQLPGETSRQIQQFASRFREQGGDLVINRSGDVSYES